MKIKRIDRRDCPLPSRLLPNVMKNEGGKHQVIGKGSLLGDNWDIGAIDEEIALLLKKLDTERVAKVAGILFYVGKLSRKRVVICKAGVGKVNAALASQILIDRFRVNAIIFSGVAGSIAPSVKIGDLVIATKTQQWDVNFTAIGFPPGVIPLMKTSVFNTNPRLVRAAVQAAKQVQENVFKGKILTGDRFVASRTLARRLRTDFGGLCVETEGAAVGQVCFRNKIPYVVIRGISDRADRKAPPDFRKFVKLAANRAQRVVLECFTCCDMGKMINSYDGCMMLKLS